MLYLHLPTYEKKGGVGNKKKMSNSKSFKSQGKIINIALILN